MAELAFKAKATPPMAERARRDQTSAFARTPHRAIPVISTDSIGTSVRESNAINTPCLPALGEGTRVVLVYRHTLLRDLYTRLFAEAGISVVAAIPCDELTNLSLIGIDSEVFVSDEASVTTLWLITQAILFRPPLATVAKLIAVGAGQMISIDFKKEVVNDASIEDLIAQARLKPVGSLQSSEATCRLAKLENT